FAGRLPRRDATLAEAERALASSEESLPEISEAEDDSVYAAAFRQGAIVVPRALFVVERPEGRLGGDPRAPFVRSRRSALEKAPWRDIPRLEGRVEAEFIKRLYVGESVAPYRIFGSELAVIPWLDAERRLLSAAETAKSGYVHIAEWLAQVEEFW